MARVSNRKKAKVSNLARTTSLENHDNIQKIDKWTFNRMVARHKKTPQKLHQTLVNTSITQSQRYYIVSRTRLVFIL